MPRIHGFTACPARAWCEVTGREERVTKREDQVPVARAGDARIVPAFVPATSRRLARASFRILGRTATGIWWRDESSRCALAWSHGSRSPRLQATGFRRQASGDRPGGPKASILQTTGPVARSLSPAALTSARIRLSVAAPMPRALSFSTPCPPASSPDRAARRSRADTPRALRDPGPSLRVFRRERNARSCSAG